MSVILILAAGDADFGSMDGGYPLCLTEFDGIPLIERIITACRPIAEARFVFAIRHEDADRFHLDNALRVLEPAARIVRAGKTRGAACTALLACREIGAGQPLLVINANQYVDIDMGELVRDFARRGLDAGVVTFRSMHPRYSYVDIDADGLVIEAAEKNPISPHATAGIYWFARGHEFIKAVQSMIRRDAHINGSFYVCPALNELVLTQARIGAFTIEPSRYHPLKTEHQLQQFAFAVDGKSVQ